MESPALPDLISTDCLPALSVPTALNGLLNTISATANGK